MRVLLINHFPLEGSGSGVYTANVATSLKKLGHEVKVIFPTNKRVDSGFYGYGVRPVYFSGDDDSVEEEALQFNFPCFTTHPMSYNTFYELSPEEENEYRVAFRNAIKEEVEAFHPDVIHCGHIWVLSAIASEFDLPLVITAHGTDLIGYQESERFRKDATLAAKKAKKIITISEKNKKLVEECFPFAKDKVVLIPNGYDAGRFYLENCSREEVLRELGIDEQFEKIVCFAGKFAHFKGIDILLNAAKEYEDDKTCTLLAGSGELFGEMQELAKRLNLRHVKFLGNQTHDVLRKIYNIADVSLAPSRNEPFGLVVVEAMACGAPVIGTNDGGIKDIITDETGILIDPEDSKGLASAILNVLSGKKQFDRKKVAEYAINHYSNDNFIQDLVEVYRV